MILGAKLGQDLQNIQKMKENVTLITTELTLSVQSGEWGGL